MSESIKVVALESAHPHIHSLIRQTQELEGAEFVGFADPNPKHRAQTKERNEFGDDMVFADYERLLDERQPDAAIICSTNTDHVKYVEALAPRGIDIMLEKPFAASLSDADRMIAACEQHGVTLMINFPTAWGPALRRAREIAQSGALGQVFQIAFRGGHMGPTGDFDTWWYRPQDGGGVLLDYCCYGSLVARWLVGEPASAVMGMRANLNSQWGDVEDNAAMIVRFPQAMALCEASWTTVDHGVSPGPIVYGSEGTLVADKAKAGQAPKVRVEKGGGRTEYHDCEPLPADRSDIAQEIIHRLETGDPLHETLDLDFNLEVMAILDAGVRSADSGHLELVDTAAWRLG